MALILKDRVKESSASSGLGNITLGGAFPGYQTFNTAIASGSTVYYTIHNINPGHDTEWEVGVGTFTAPTTLSRDTVFSSSASGSKVNFTSGAGGLEVFVTQPAEQALYTNQATGKVEVFGDGTNTVAFTNINASNVVMVSGTISTNASNATDITNKQYVDNLFSTGITYHAPVLVETPTALTATYNQPGGAGNGVGATLTNSGANVALTIDGVLLSNTARVLVYQQANAVQNGVYTVTNPGAPDPGGSQWVLTRATDADTYGVGNPNKLGQGDAFFVTSGNTGAGETYILNTVGAITFGTTNLTFAQISSAQIYNAGTGLNLANLTFSIANTAVTAATYDGAGNTVSLTVNQQGQLTNVASVPINASSITVGTLANARTTASDANGASTIVSRDSTGSFTANTITATTVNATTGNFTNITANAAGLTDINASNITSGTISNARTTGSTSNSASTIVLRDANGAFEAGNVTASNFIGAGTTITSINASNISSGTIGNSRTTAASANGASTIVQRDAGGNFSANTITANISGDISGGTNINASNITSGTINNARTTASSANGASTIVLRDVNGSFDANVVNATNLSGGGTSITSMNASNLSAGTVASARISGSYTGITGVGTVTAGTWQGNTIANVYTTANASNSASTIVARDANGSFATNVISYGAGSNTAPSITFTGDTNTGIFSPTADTIAFSEGGVESMRIDASGNVGIGTNSPAAALHIFRSGSTTVASRLANDSVSMQTYVDANFCVTGTITNNAYIIATNNTERMRIDSSGNVSQSAGSYFLGNGGGFGWGDLSTYVGGSSATDIINFITNTSERMRIDASGNVGIGTTSPTSVLTVRTGGTGSGTLSLAAATGGGGGSAIVMGNADSGGTAGPSVIAASNRTITFGLGNSFTSASGGTFTEYMRMSSDGGFSVGTTSSPGAGGINATGNITAFFSDKRLKTVSGKIENALDKVNSLSGVYYTMNDVAKSHGYDSNETQVGVLAQEVEAVLPEVVKPAPFDLDENGNSKSGENYKTVQYEKLIPLLIEAIKELKAEIDELKAKG